METEEEFTKIQEFIYELRVSHVMTKNPVVVSPETHMSKLREILRSNRISGVPVVENDMLIGLISIEDFIKWLADEREGPSVAENLTTDVETIYEDSPLVEALKKFDALRYGRFPVINREDKKLVGVITKGDIIKGLLKKLEAEYLQEELFTYRASHIFEDIVADKATLRFQYYVKGKDFTRAGECASGLRKTLKRLGFHPRVIRKVAIAAYEAEINVIIYADEGEITAEVEPHNLRLRIQDKGPGIEDIEQAMRPGYSTASEWVRELGFGAGMGLCNIKKCSDEMNISSTPGEGTQLDIGISLDYRQDEK